MVKSMYAGVAGLRAHQQKMDVIGNNIANVNTLGFKSSSVAFKDAMYTTLTSAQGGNIGVGGFGGQNPNQVGYGVTLGTVEASFVSGGRMPSSNGLHSMIDGTGFFIVGPMLENEFEPADLAQQGLNLTRVGMFSIDENGYVVDSNRNYVYGYTNTADVGDDPAFNDTLTPLRVPLGDDGQPLKLEGTSIKADGSIVGITEDKRTVVLGQAAVATVQNPNGLQKTSGYYYSITENSGLSTAVARDQLGVAGGQILGNTLEMSNVELAGDFSDMITTQRGFQANSKIITVTDQMLEELVNLKR